METIAVSKLKASLSEFLKRVQAGNEVIVTDRGKPVAKLVSIKPNESISQDLKDMEKEGLIVIGQGKIPKNFWTFPRPKDSKGMVVKTIIEERMEGY